MVGDTRWVGGHDWFAVGGGWVVNFIFLLSLCSMLLDSVPDMTPPIKVKKKLV